jgi:excisionase family DNA binding protein
LTAPGEPSVGRADRSDRCRRRARAAGTPVPDVPADERDDPAGSDRLLTIGEVIAELQVSRAAFYRWRRQGTGPAAVRLPGGGVRIRRSALRQWLGRLEDPSQEEPAA